MDLDDSAERNLGSAVESRLAFADLIQVLGDGRLIGGMDFLFAGTHDPKGDKAMVDAAGRMDSLVLAVVPVDPGITKFTGARLDLEDEAILQSHLWHPVVVNPGTIPEAETFLLPFPDLARHSRFLGHIGVRPDDDGIYRRSALFYRWKDGYMPCLSLALAVSALHVDPSQIVVNAGDSVTLPTRQGGIRIPVDREGYAWIPYPAPWDRTWKRIPLDKVVEADDGGSRENALISDWDGQVILAADLTTSHKDFGPSPLESIYPLSGIHTSLLNAMLTRTFISSAPPMMIVGESLVLLAAALCMGWLRRPGIVDAGFASLLAITIGWTLVWWFGKLVRPWAGGPFFAIIGAWAGSIAFRSFKAHEKRILLESALSRYFPRALASRVLSENKVDLKPAQKELTMLFADIAGFTSWSSDKPPELVHRFLTEYLESMATILFAQGGTVDKFMGDGILAFFGDPFAQPDHAERCLNAALGMQRKVNDLRTRWLPEARLDLRIRIGVNSGQVIVGNLGSKTRIEYTVIGAAVNLAQRMESNAPEGGILVTAETWSRTCHAFRFSEPIETKVKGYDERQMTYLLMGRL